MVEQLSPVPDQLIAPFPSLAIRERNAPEYLPFQPLILPAIEVLAGQVHLEKVYNTVLKRMQRLSKQLTKIRPEADIFALQDVSPRKPRPFSTDDLLPTTRAYIEMLDHPPLLPAPPSFEAAFSPYENMFHTVFYRRYPYERLNDAKQDALIHLWKHWKRDMTLLEQSAAYVVQAAIWGASPHRKIEREKRVQDHELPMLQYERYIDIRVADQSRDPSWVRRIDRSVDVQDGYRHCEARASGAAERCRIACRTWMTFSMNGR